MGVTIFYRARLADEARVRALTEELRDIAVTMNWPHRVFDEDWSKPHIFEVLEDSQGVPRYPLRRHPLKGIFFRPHSESEAVYFLFRPDGRMTDLLSADLSFRNPADGWVFTKTQFAGTDLHIALVRLLRYLQSKYLPDLEVTDEGGYWQTEDRAELQRRLLELDTSIEILNAGIENLRPEDRRDEEKLLERIEEVLRRLRGKS